MKTADEGTACRIESSTPPNEAVSLLVVIAGPAGSGKTTLCDRLVAEDKQVERVVTCTTRAPRDGEVDGKDYYFLNDQQFDQAIDADAFLESANVHGNRYGVLKQSIQEKLDAHLDIVMNIDVQGVRNIRRAAAQDPTLRQRLLSIFIYPSDLEVVRERLRRRGKDDEREIENRVETAKKEIVVWPEFDYVIVTKSKEEDFEALRSILRAEKLRVARLA